MSPTQASAPPRISVLLAVKDAADHLPGCLDSLTAQSAWSEAEVLVIDGSAGHHEQRIVEAYQRGHRQIRYARREPRGLYAAWNQGVREARGEYLCNLNVDDRLGSQALAHLSEALDAQPEVAVVYGDSLWTQRPYQSFAAHSAEGTLTWPAYQHKRLLRGCLCGPHPMWRRRLHDELGLFDESLVVAGDYEFWLRVAERYPLLHLEEVVGLYYRNPSGLQQTNPGLHRRERLLLMRKYLGSGGPR